MGVTRFGNLFAEDRGAKKRTLLYCLFGLDTRDREDAPQAILSHEMHLSRAEVVRFPQVWISSLSDALVVRKDSASRAHLAIATNTAQLFGG